MEQRNSAFEIMRILAMFMIILGHCMLATAENTEPYLGILDCTGWGGKSLHSMCSKLVFSTYWIFRKQY